MHTSFLEGVHTASAQVVLRKDPTWVAPVLWQSEFRNVLWLYLRQGYLSLSDALQYMREALTLLGETVYPVDSAIVLDLALQSGCTAYDCEFVCVAQLLDVPIVTSDAKVLRAFPGIAISMDEFVRS